MEMCEVMIAILLFMMNSCYCYGNQLQEKRLYSFSDFIPVQYDQSDAGKVPEQDFMSNTVPIIRVFNPKIEKNIQFLNSKPMTQHLYSQIATPPFKNTFKKVPALRNLLLREKVESTHNHFWINVEDPEPNAPIPMLYEKPWSLPPSQTEAYGTVLDATVKPVIGEETHDNNLLPKLPENDPSGLHQEWIKSLHTLNAFKTLSLSSTPETLETKPYVREDKSSSSNSETFRGYQLNVNHVYKDGTKAVSYSSISYGP
ncbi:hypothetical protein FQR65_LT06838 [Abscondita terminalis]|nr:hypothetical protein FQR65_LT06838 [Abscondita terminalis]